MNDAIITVIAQRAHEINQCMLIRETHKNQFLSHGENITLNAVLLSAQILPTPPQSLCFNASSYLLEGCAVMEV
jgi:hypothetical protein